MRLVLEEGRSLTAAAAEIGVGKATLSRWVAKAEGEAGRPEVVDVSLSPEEELKQLRKRVRELEMEKEILKKAAAFFAKEST